jgi:hypothetical protein
LFLNRKWFEDALACESVDQVGLNAEVGEIHYLCCLLSYFLPV